MPAPDPILRVGLTGGIASGKTTVGGTLATLGALVIDADELTHALMEPGTPVHDRVVERFGHSILDGEGRIVRPRLARIVFGEQEERLALNAIVHPAVMTEADRRIADHSPRSRIAVFDAALLVETGLHREFHRLIVVRCSRDSQIRRLLVRGDLSIAEADARIDAQAPLADKLALADYVVDTEGTLRETRKQTEGVYAALLADFERELGPA